MPFEVGATARKKIAVIGAGISGMGAAERLAASHRVVLFEAELRLGGHARTIIAGKRGDRPVDTGFIVFNYATYPHLTALFDRLDVPVVKSNMSFGASIRGGALEYGLDSAAAFFAQKRNALNPSFLVMLRYLPLQRGRARRLARGRADHWRTDREDAPWTVFPRLLPASIFRRDLVYPGREGPRFSSPCHGAILQESRAFGL